MGFGNADNFSTGARQLSNKELEQLSNIANNGNFFDNNKDFIITETLREIKAALALDRAQLKEIDIKFIPVEKNFSINNRRLDILKRMQSTPEIELQILDIESKNIEFETTYYDLKDLRDGLVEEIVNKEKEIKNLEKQLNKNSKLRR